MRIEKDERAILIALYDATDGANWRNNTNWKTDKPLSEWYGVETNDTGRVTGLRLHRNRLSGSLPSELGQLTNLKKLWLSYNDLSGQIPVELGQLTNLEHLELSDNELSGPIPVELSKMTNLERLQLGNNQLSGSIPSSLRQLKNLKELELGGNTNLDVPA